MATNIKATKTAARTTARRPARRPAPTPAPEPSPFDPPGSEFEVLRLTTRTDRDEERVPLFYIDDREYSVARRPGVNVGMQFLHLYRTQGEVAATDYVLGRLLGEDGYRALREYDDLSVEQFRQICQVVIKLALGPLELPKE